jgi:hypothetical protein
LGAEAACTFPPTGRTCTSGVGAAVPTSARRSAASEPLTARTSATASDRSSATKVSSGPAQSAAAPTPAGPPARFAATGLPPPAAAVAPVVRPSAAAAAAAALTPGGAAASSPSHRSIRGPSRAAQPARSKPLPPPQLSLPRAVPSAASPTRCSADRADAAAAAVAARSMFAGRPKVLGASRSGSAATRAAHWRRSSAAAAGGRAPVRPGSRRQARPVARSGRSSDENMASMWARRTWGCGRRAGSGASSRVLGPHALIVHLFERPSGP